MTMDAIPWEQLNHAYGPANDVPSILDAVGSSEANCRTTARIALIGNVSHQGTRYSATYWRSCHGTGGHRPKNSWTLRWTRVAIRMFGAAAFCQRAVCRANNSVGQRT